MKKIKQKIKNKLRKYLCIDNIEDQLNVFANDIEQQSRKIRRVEEQYNSTIDTSKQLHETSQFLISQFNLAADIYSKGDRQSWAVISIAGKPEYVRFVNLSNQDMRSIHSFLKQFEGTNRTVDSPGYYFWK